jgi:hypothetical protein
MSATHPGRFPLTQAEKAERKRKMDEFAAQQDALDPQVRSDRMYRFLLMEGRQLIEAGDKQAEVEQRLLARFTRQDLKIMAAIASGRLTKQAWDEMGPDGRARLHRPGLQGLGAVPGRP